MVGFIFLGDFQVCKCGNTAKCVGEKMLCINEICGDVECINNS